LHRTTLALLAALIACGGPRRFYEGPALPSDEVALLVVEGGMIGEEMRFDAQLARFDSLPMRTPPKRSEILGGDHVLDVSWVQWAMAPNENRTWVRINEGVEHIEFRAREGRTYTIAWGTSKPVLKVRGETP